jgi:hypothetical protein
LDAFGDSFYHTHPIDWNLPVMQPFVSYKHILIRRVYRDNFW